MVFSTAVLEASFSESRRDLDWERSLLSPKILQALWILQEL